jgi:hypothetical protein
MIQINDTLVSMEVIEEAFVCDLKACKGACCVEGDAGAPLNEVEVKILADIFPKVSPFLRKEGVEAIKSQGTSVVDDDGDLVTPLVEGKECAYTVFSENGTAQCGIELAWKSGEVSFRKPISCHLYPIRIKQYKGFEAVNYEQWHICKPACKLGQALKVPVYTFVKDALVRKYGEDWYDELKTTAEALHKMG